MSDYRYQCVIGLSVRCHRAFRFCMNTSAFYRPLHQLNNTITVFNLILDTAMLRKPICKVWCRPNPVECAVQLISSVSAWVRTSRFPSADRKACFTFYFLLIWQGCKINAVKQTTSYITTAHVKWRLRSGLVNPLTPELNLSPALGWLTL
jgi:hypothetical protein